MAQSQSQEKKPGKNMLWGGRFTGSFNSIYSTCLGRFHWGERGVSKLGQSC